MQKPLSHKLFWSVYIPSCAVFFLYNYFFNGWFQLGDDTYIYLQYSRNLIETGQLAFNPGEISYGFTSPLWLALITLTVKITGSYLASPAIVTMFISFCTIGVWILIVLKQKGGTLSVLFGILVIIFEPNLGKHSFFGMEASLSFFLSTVLIYYILDESPRYTALGIIAGLAVMVRPESVLISTLIFIYLLYTKRNYKGLLKLLLAFIMVILPWVVFASLYYHRILPDTFFAKGAAYESGSHFVLVLQDTIKIIAGGYLFLLILILFAFIKKRNIPSVFWLFISFIIVLILFYAVVLSREYVYARYYCLVFPFLNFIAVYYADKEINKPSAYKYLLFVLLGCHVIFNSYWSIEKKKIYDANTVSENLLDKWIIKNTRKSDMLLYGKIGKIAFDTKRSVFDEMGIIDKNVYINIKSGTISNYLHERKPLYLIDNNDFYMSELKKKASVTVVDSIPKPSLTTLREKLSKIPATDVYIKIYKIHWDNLR